MIRLNGYGSFNFSNGRKQANLLDTSFLNFPHLNPVNIFSYRRTIPPEGVDAVVQDIKIHFAHIIEAIAKREVYVLDCVQTEISSLEVCIETWRRHLHLSHAPSEFRYGLNSYSQEYKRLIHEIRRQGDLDPRHRFSADEAQAYRFLLGKVRENSQNLYNPLVARKIHSERGEKLETDRHLATMMLFYNQNRDVKLFGNDRDIAEVCKNTGDALLSEGMRPTVFNIYHIRCPRPDWAYTVSEIEFKAKPQVSAVQQKNINAA